MDCCICLEEANIPIKLPCKHIFCFLCIKGEAENYDRAKCPLCRAGFDLDYLKKPELVDDLKSNSVWKYSGRNFGWWDYDEKTNLILEEEYKKDPKSRIEIYISGAEYIIDFEQMVQIRKNLDRIRNIKRDETYISKGIAGIRISD